MANVTDFLSQLHTLTKNNLEILKTINESFLSKKDHLMVNIEGAQYSIPSFLFLENKINYLEENFQNLINSPASGEANFVLNGDTRSIEVKKYNSSPNSIALDPVNNFYIKSNNIFKDFLTPIPYIKFELNDIPNDIVSVNVKKVIARNSELIKRFSSILSDNASKRYPYKDIFKILSIYKKEEDYIEYDTVYDMPIRKNIGHATYVIESIVSDIIDKDLDNYIELKLRNDLDEDIYSNSLTYKLFDETIEKSLVVGDYLTNNDGTAKLQITELKPKTNTIIVKVINGEYTNFIGTDTYDSSNYINELSKIKFYSSLDFDKDKYIDIPLEEDQYVFIAIAPLNNRMNIQSSWGKGVIVDTFKLTLSSQDGTINGKDFDSYYDENVRNIGDVLFEITSIISQSTLTKFNKNEFENFVTYKPKINTSNLIVTQINNHLNNSKTVQNIRSLYSQKKKYNSELNEIQSKISEINENITNISFDDVNNLRNVYMSQLSDYNKKKVELVNNITKITDEISIAANDSVIPIENAKYRIRGFYDYLSLESPYNSHIIGIEVQYRYKNKDNIQNQILSFDDKFVYTDWNIMDNFINTRVPKYDVNYKYNWVENNDLKNEPSFNQIDIPISQGEIVDIKLKLLYDFGYPFIETTSDWSDIVSIEFPEEYLKDVQILDIIEENNKEIEENKFNNLLNKNGINEHVNDNIVDQNITYYHTPNNIASGFYTAERRIIPLIDKLNELHNSILELKSEVFNYTADSLTISLNIGDTNSNIIPWESNMLYVEPYSKFIGNTNTNINSYSVNSNGVVSTIINLILTNTSDQIVKLYPMFPGNKTIYLNNVSNGKFNIYDYCFKESTSGVWLKNQSGQNSSNAYLQSCNQFITFRVNDINTNEFYYVTGEVNPTSNFWNTNNKLSAHKSGMNLSYFTENTPNGCSLCPYIKDRYSLCVDSSAANYTVINPTESIVIPLLFEYKLEKNSQISKTMSFDLRTSLYKDPVNYNFTITAKYENHDLDNLANNNRKINNIKYNSTINKIK